MHVKRFAASQDQFKTQITYTMTLRASKYTCYNAKCPLPAQAHAAITLGPMIAGSLRRGVFRSFGAMLIKRG
jgi:hypothetical protein